MAAAQIAMATNTFLGPLMDAAGNDYRIIASSSAIFWTAVRLLLGKTGSVDWYAVLHAVITAIGSILCIYFDLHASEIDPKGTPEPLRSIRCASALTVLHTLLPIVSLGYAVHDLVDGIYLKRADFFAHGLFLMVCLVIVCEMGAPHLVVAGLVMELSTLPLNLLKVQWSRPSYMLANATVLVLTFFLGRIVAFPWLWARWIDTFREEHAKGEPMCYPSHFIYIVVAFGSVFHVLNFYWFALIVRGIWRKLHGKKPRLD